MQGENAVRYVGSPRHRAELGRLVTARLDANPDVRKVNVDHAQLYYHLDFLDSAECDALIAYLDRDNRPSTLSSAGPDPEFRTSYSSDLERWDPQVRVIDDRISALLGLPPENGETVQGQIYSPGQQFRAHFDWFQEESAFYDGTMKNGGQRVWTAMAYLNDVDAGGSTWFPQLGVRVAPRRGMLLAWNNMDADGMPNRATIHEGCKVEAGVKYIITKWIREESWIHSFLSS